VNPKLIQKLVFPIEYDTSLLNIQEGAPMYLMQIISYSKNNIQFDDEKA